MRHTLLILWIVALLGCAQHAAEPEAASSSTEAMRPAAGATIPWLPAVRRAHAEADAARTPAAVDRAIAALTAVFEQARPGARNGAIRQDLAGRIAALHRQRSQPADALIWAQRGLRIETAPSILTAHLHLERARAAEEVGRAALAETARGEARAINAALAGGG